MKPISKRLSSRFTPKNIALCLTGSFIYVIALNLFITPAALYAGGFTGLSQLIANALKTKIDVDFNLQALIYFLLDVPLFLTGARILGGHMIIRSFLIALSETLFMAFIPIPKSPIIIDTFAALVIGGCLEGIGSAITFSGFGSSGGTDLLGLMLTEHYRNLSVGRVSLMVNAIVYSIAAICYSVQTAIYSLVAEVFCSLMIDRYHKQNNLVAVNIISNHYNELSEFITHELERGATLIQAEGAYTGDKHEMLVSVVSKYELEMLEKRCEDIDPDAFIFIHPNINVMGDFQKRFS